MKDEFKECKIKQLTVVNILTTSKVECPYCKKENTIVQGRVLDNKAYIHECNFCKKGFKLKREEYEKYFDTIKHLCNYVQNIG